MGRFDAAYPRCIWTMADLKIETLIAFLKETRVGKKLVDTLAVTEIGFWDKLADVYWQQNKLPRPASTKPKPAPTTPGTPDRIDAP